MTDAADTARLYLATPPRLDLAEFPALLAQTLATGHVACVRLDLPGAEEAAIRKAADVLRPVCHDADVALVIADHYRLAAPLGLDGVHVGGPAKYADIRKEIGADQILGVHAGASRHMGMTAAEAGADYVAFGPVADTGLGDGAVAEADLFQWWSEMIETPVVADGGVSDAHLATLSPITDFVVPGADIWDDPLPRLAAMARALT